MTTATKVSDNFASSEAIPLPKKSMKIGFDAKRVFSNFTGLGNYSRFVVRALSTHFPQNEYMLLAARPEGHPEAQGLIAQPNISVGTPSSAIKTLKLDAWWRSMMMGKTAQNKGMELLHGLSNELPFRSPKGLKKVVTIHDLLFLRYPQLYNIIDAAIYKQKFSRACKDADRVIAVSRQTARDLVDFLKVPEEKIDVVYQGCHEHFRQEYDSYVLERVSSRHKLPPDFILNVGTIEERKNGLLIVKALHELKNKVTIPLVMVGKPTSYKQEIVEYAREHDLLDQIYFRHDIPFEDLPKIYQLSKMFVYPSVFEGFGIPILEALCSRVPVISSKGSCFAEAGGPNSIYVNPTNAEELAEAILRVINNATMGTKMVIDGVAHSLNFEEKKIAQDLMAVYEKTLHG